MKGYLMSNTVIKFDNVTKIYKLYKKDKHRLLDVFRKNTRAVEKCAVDHVSFSVKGGESVAIFGKNGAGKSTLLKMVTGVCFPTSGQLQIHGTVSALLELTAGFDPEFTGAENIFLKGQLMGLSDQAIRSLMDDIVEFAEIGEYLHQPVRTYSSGMKARLGFSINANIKPEILIVDEALSVGDATFKRKCLDKINQLIKTDGITLLFVTHTTSIAKEFCRRGIVMLHGRIAFDGAIQEAISYYNTTLLPTAK